MRTWSDIGVITGTKNSQGGIVVKGSRDLLCALTHGVELALVPPILDAPRLVHVASVDDGGKDSALIYFDEIDSRDEAEARVGCHCLIKRSDLENISIEYCGRSFVGYDAYDRQVGFVGVVSDVDDERMQTLLYVKRPDGNIVLVPLVDSIVVHVDHDAERLDLDCPAGLLDLS